MLISFYTLELVRQTETDGKQLEIDKARETEAAKAIDTGALYLLVQFEGVAECMQSLGLVRVCLSQGGRDKFQEVLIVTHLCYGHTVELIYKRMKKM